MRIYISEASIGLFCLTIHSSGLFKPAEQAFKEARAIFEDQGTTDPKKKRRLESLNVTTLEDLLSAVDDTRKHYDKYQSGSKMRRCMEQVSERIHYYGNIMDVLAQHHPEYVSLAWGTMKILVGVRPNSAIKIDAFPQVTFIRRSSSIRN